ncbi:MAG: cell wall hydrolase [Clostridiales bacterium]|nr:cell wall hydrolase [Clostridiales bacterium]
MLTICSFLQSFCRLMHTLTARTVSVTKRMHRTSAILMTGTAVIAVLSFSCGVFSGGGRNALTAYAGAASLQEEVDPIVEEETETEGTVLLTQANIPFHLVNSENRQRGRQLVGATLARSVEREQEMRSARQTAIRKNKEEIRRIAQQRAEEERLLAEEEARQAAAVVRYSDQDYEVLTRIVQAEAGVCDMKGKILVANVVINRVRDNEFPDVITDVVYQKNQFSPVGNGSINRCHVSDETVEAVDRALAGEDYSDGALYFMNRGVSQSGNVRWFDGSLTYLFQYDGHEFFK